MTSPGIEAQGSPDAPLVAWFIHGILGRGRNFRSFARRVATTWPAFRVLLPDLRCHGEAPAQLGPHTLVACAEDLEEIASRYGRPSVVVGHSFGGKVALRWASLGYAAADTALWVLDSPPGAVTQTRSTSDAADPVRILSLLRSIETPAESRESLRTTLRSAGVDEAIIAWLLTSAVERGGGWDWLWDLDGVESMLLDYAKTDLWPYLRAPEPEIHLLRAGRSDRWSADDLARLSALDDSGSPSAHVLPDAGHWVHADDPDGVIALLAPSFAARAAMASVD